MFVAFDILHISLLQKSKLCLCVTYFGSQWNKSRTLFFFFSRGCLQDSERESIYVSQNVCWLCASSQFKLHIDVKPWVTFSPPVLEEEGQFRISLLVLVFRSCLIFQSAGRAAGMMHHCRTTMTLASPRFSQQKVILDYGRKSSSWQIQVHETDMLRLNWDSFIISLNTPIRFKSVCNWSLQCFTAHLFLQPLHVNKKTADKVSN